MGHVYRARHVELGKLFALKIIAPTLAGDPSVRARFELEAKLASEITHANIVSVFDYGVDDEIGAYMVMELVEGEPLLFADASTPMSIRRALDVLGQVADALDHIHKRGIVHGDIKGDNILVVAETSGSGSNRRRSVVRLLDFGLARRFGVEDEELHGTPAYLAPERVAGGPATIATDIYALGCLGYLLFTRTLPFQGSVVEVLTAQVEHRAPKLSERRGEEVDPAIESLISRAIAKDPAYRHPNAAAFRYEINTIMDMMGLRRRMSKQQLAVPAPAPTSSTPDLFDESPFAQAIVRADGLVVAANRAFLEFAGSELAGRALSSTRLARRVPQLLATIRRSLVEGKPLEWRGVEDGGELAVWTRPVKDTVHVIVHQL
jgi:serine/threonine-protein kinase